jgi:hypothetical protein
MKKSVNFSDFADAFQAIRPDNFSYSGLQALFDYLEEIEAGQGEELELDVIALCCEFSEYSSALKAAKEQGFKPDEDEDREAEALEWLQERTTVIEFSGGVIVEDF